ncbi:alpha/beta hydrolase [Chloroflexota bacterium]
MHSFAGGTSAIQIALRHRDRCTALVPLPSAAPGETETALPPQPLVRVMFKSDFLFWVLTTYFRSSLRSMMGVPKGFEWTPEYQVDVAQVMRTILPVNPRSDGAVFDVFVSNADINAGCPLEEIAVPVLIISAADDPLTLYVIAQAAAEEIPGARLVTIEDGGHMLLGHQARIRTEIVAFLEGYAVDRP